MGINAQAISIRENVNPGRTRKECVVHRHEGSVTGACSAGVPDDLVSLVIANIDIQVILQYKQSNLPLTI